jgi:capsular polysaccharide biosynthesis protein
MISDLTISQAAGISVIRQQVASPSSGIQPLPLIAGTERFAHSWLADWHRELHHWAASDIACYSFINAVVSGTGQVWLDGQLITSPEIMPPYVANGLGVANGRLDTLNTVGLLPLRVIEQPCLVAIGHGIRVYGHFLIELLFRILIARLAHNERELPYRVLLDHEAPDWLLQILHNYLDVKSSDVEFFKPKVERVLLRHAIVPTRPLQNERFHPAANEMLEELVERLQVKSSVHQLRRVFIARNRFTNPSAPSRSCVNEQRLIDVAVTRHGFTAVAIEDMIWIEQIAVFRDAEVVLGLAGSGLHNALFSKPGSRLASIGVMNLVQSQIGALRGQRNGFLSKDVGVAGNFEVDEKCFTEFLDGVCA